MGVNGLIRKLALSAGIMLLGLVAACGGDGDGDGSSSDFGGLFPKRANVVGSVAFSEALEAIDLDQFLDMLSSDSQDEDEGFDEMIDLDRVEGRVKASSVKKVGEIVNKHPEEAVAILRNWMYQQDQ